MYKYKKRLIFIAIFGWVIFSILFTSCGEDIAVEPEEETPSVPKIAPPEPYNNNLIPQLKSAFPSDGDTSVHFFSNITLTFDQDVEVVSGADITISPFGGSGDLIIDAGDTERVIVSNAEVTITNDNFLLPNTDYWLYIDAGTFKSGAGADSGIIQLFFTTMDKLPIDNTMFLASVTFDREADITTNITTNEGIITTNIKGNDGSFAGINRWYGAQIQFPKGVFGKSELSDGTKVPFEMVGINNDVAPTLETPVSVSGVPSGLEFGIFRAYLDYVDDQTPYGFLRTNAYTMELKGNAVNHAASDSTNFTLTLHSDFFYIDSPYYKAADVTFYPRVNFID
jgi:hypothetical protein